jgi:hypothetical protein
MNAEKTLRTANAFFPFGENFWSLLGIFPKNGQIFTQNRINALKELNIFFQRSSLSHTFSW